MIKSTRMKRKRHVTRIREGSGMSSVLVGKPEGKRPMGYTDVDRRIILKWIFRK
jgi:hypothetical protein